MLFSTCFVASCLVWSFVCFCVATVCVLISVRVLVCLFVLWFCVFLCATVCVLISVRVLVCLFVLWFCVFLCCYCLCADFCLLVCLFLPLLLCCCVLCVVATVMCCCCAVGVCLLVCGVRVCGGGGGAEDNEADFASQAATTCLGLYAVLRVRWVAAREKGRRFGLPDGGDGSQLLRHLDGAVGCVAGRKGAVSAPTRR